VRVIDLHALLSAHDPRRVPAGGRVALVSDGEHGLGFDIVRMLAERGMRVVLGTTSLPTGRLAIDRLGHHANQVVVRELDTTDGVSVDTLVAWLAQRLGRCDVLVNNAHPRIGDGAAAAAAVDLDAVRCSLETDLFGTWRLTQAVVPLMRGRRYGRIVNMSGRPDGPEQSATRRVAVGAVGALTSVLAAELAPDGILVNLCVAAAGARAGALSGPAAVPVWLATLPDGGPTGGSFGDRPP
jgi:NAD(P)-dependent dehydrogenase (short-subunit alcohol dehydrogenase family)